ncbi:MAG: cell wall-active antibiotics response protein [Chloroflexi bacterium]|nr:cell wall-active antibiotics response protein [Chloroflexota bacterium]
MKRNSVFWGLALILVGVLLLLNSLGLISVNIGILLLAVLLIAIGAWLLWGLLLGRDELESEDVAIPLQTASRANIHIRHGAGRLKIAAGTDHANLITGTVDGGLDCTTTMEGDTLNVAMAVPVKRFPDFGMPWMWGRRGTLDWNLYLIPSTALALHLETGASETQLDLSDLQVSDLRLQTGASSTQITLPEHAGDTHVEVHGGAAAIEIRVPEGVAARIRTSGRLSGIRVNAGRFVRDGALYESPEFGEAANRVEIDAEIGVGSLEIF